MQGINSVRRTSENITRQSLKAIEGLASQSEMLRNVRKICWRRSIRSPTASRVRDKPFCRRRARSKVRTTRSMQRCRGGTPNSHRRSTSFRARPTSSAASSRATRPTSKGRSRMPSSGPARPPSRSAWARKRARAQPSPTSNASARMQALKSERTLDDLRRRFSSIRLPSTKSFRRLPRGSTKPPTMCASARAALSMRSHESKPVSDRRWSVFQWRRARTRKPCAARCKSSCARSISCLNTRRSRSAAKSPADGGGRRGRQRCSVAASRPVGAHATSCRASDLEPHGRLCERSSQQRCHRQLSSLSLAESQRMMQNTGAPLQRPGGGLQQPQGGLPGGPRGAASSAENWSLGDLLKRASFDEDPHGAHGAAGVNVQSGHLPGRAQHRRSSNRCRRTSDTISK